MAWGVALHDLGDLDAGGRDDEILKPHRSDQMSVGIDHLSAVDSLLVGRFAMFRDFFNPAG